ncbi:hypothetical protein ACX80H_06110 [Arthrobacter sp. MDT2-2]
MTVGRLVVTAARKSTAPSSNTMDRTTARTGVVGGQPVQRVVADPR